MKVKMREREIQEETKKKKKKEEEKEEKNQLFSGSLTTQEFSIELICKR